MIRIVKGNFTAFFVMSTNDSKEIPEEKEKVNNSPQTSTLLYIRAILLIEIYNYTLKVGTFLIETKKVGSFRRNPY